jgi:hypothetical protein
MSNVPRSVRKATLTTWESVAYAAMNLALAAGYLRKVPAKKAMQDFGLVELTAAEQAFYLAQCAFFGAGYFAKIPTAKALAELAALQANAGADLAATGSPEAASSPDEGQLGSAGGPGPADPPIRGAQGSSA